MPIVICLPLKPRSLNARPSVAYKEAISNAARERHTGALFDVPLYSRIIWFHKYVTTQGDVDNVAKRIHDALKDVLFSDDRVITHTMTVRVDVSAGVEIASDPENPDAAIELSEQLALTSTRDVLYIEIGIQVDTQTRLGPLS